MKRKIKIKIDVVVDNYEEQDSDGYLTYALQEDISEVTGIHKDYIDVEVETIDDDDE